MGWKQAEGYNKLRRQSNNDGCCCVCRRLVGDQIRSSGGRTDGLVGQTLGPFFTKIMGTLMVVECGTHQNVEELRVSVVFWDTHPNML